MLCVATQERELYTERRTLLSHLGDILRKAAVYGEHQRLLEDLKDGSKSNRFVKYAYISCL